MAEMDKPKAIEGQISEPPGFQDLDIKPLEKMTEEELMVALCEYPGISLPQIDRPSPGRSEAKPERDGDPLEYGETGFPRGLAQDE